MHANSPEEIKEVRAGDIAAAVGLKTVMTGVLCAKYDNFVILERMDFSRSSNCGCSRAKN